MGSVVIEGFDEDEESAQTDTRSVTLAFQVWIVGFATFQSNLSNIFFFHRTNGFTWLALSQMALLLPFVPLQT